MVTLVVFVFIHMVFAGFGTKSRYVTDVTHTVSVVIVAKIGKASTANIADVVILQSYVLGKIKSLDLETE